MYVIESEGYNDGVWRPIGEPVTTNIWRTIAAADEHKKANPKIRVRVIEIKYVSQ